MAAFDAAAQAQTANTYVQHLQTLADAAIARLSESATTWSYTTLQAVSNLNLPAVSLADGAKPALIVPTLPTLTPADFASVASPVLPAAPSLTGATSPLWSDVFWTDLKTKIAAFTDGITGADDVDSVVTKLSSDTTKLQVALYAKDYERRTQVLRDLYSAADAATGAKGFTYPNSMTVALKMDAQQKFQFDMSQTARDLIDRIFEWARTGYQFSLQQGISAHNSDADFNVRYLGVTVEVYRSQVSAIVDKYRADVAALVSQAESKVAEYRAQVETELEKHKTLLDIQIKDAGFDLEVAKINAAILTADVQNKVEDFKARVASFLETTKVNTEILDANAKNRIHAAQVAATATASMANAVATVTVNSAGA